MDIVTDTQTDNEFASVGRLELTKGGVLVDHGTAFLIGPRHAITSLHLTSHLADASVELTFLLRMSPSAASLFSYKIRVVTPHSDPALDWALLELDASEPSIDAIEAPLLRTTRAVTGEPFRSFGYALTNPTDGIVFSGKVEDSSALCGGNRALQLFSVQVAAPGTKVGGHSGAPVFSKGAVVGVVRAFIQSDATAVAGTLYACPIDEVLRDAHVRALARTDPCIGIPPLPAELTLPEDPFRYLHPYRPQDARIFFGRCREIRSLARTLESAGIVLVHGQSGVGKSSLLAAGLLPRLSSRFEVRIARRSRQFGLNGDLAVLLGITRTHSSSLAQQWQSLERQPGARPLLLVLDQVEEAWTRPRDSIATSLLNEVDSLAQLLQTHFAPGRRPTSRIVLSLRKEWLPELQECLRRWSVPSIAIGISPITQEGIEEVVHSIPNDPALSQFYRLRVADNVGQRIATDLASDQDSSIAPALQILLTNLWIAARQRDSSHPQIDLDLYRDLTRRGHGLDRFLSERLAALPASCRPFVESGLALDVLHFFTTESGVVGAVAEQRTEADIASCYGPRAAEAMSLVLGFVDTYLLADTRRTVLDATQAINRLAHDLLAPVVRVRFSRSQAPGQRARRILEAHTQSLANDGHPRTLDEDDLRHVLLGEKGMRARTREEEQLVRASINKLEQVRAAERRRRILLRILVALAVTAALVIVVLYRRAVETNQRLLELSDLRRVQELEHGATELWPPWPAQIPMFRKWQDDAAILEKRWPSHKEALYLLRDEARSEDDVERKSSLEWWSTQLEELDSRIDHLLDRNDGIRGDGISRGYGWGVAKRLAFAKDLQTRDSRAAWDACRSRIASAQAYESSKLNLDPLWSLTAQMGLVPIGPDPSTHLEEFAVLGSGSIPQRDTSGAIQAVNTMAIVLVLLPGGEFLMGAKACPGVDCDECSTDRERPVVGVQLDPFFVGKYEISQAQWLAFTASNPSRYSPQYHHERIPPTTLLYPVEQVTWTECDATLRHFGLSLPTEAQWEYACRGGSHTAWSTGNTVESLQGSVNVADRAAFTIGEYFSGTSPVLDDGFQITAPVVALKPNAYGLVSMHGNVNEWCLDKMGKYEIEPQAGTGFRDVADDVGRVYRGGSFYTLPQDARSAFRQHVPESYSYGDMGVRAARALVREH